MVLGQGNGVKALRALTEGVSSLPLLLEGEEGVGKRTATMSAIAEVGSNTDRKLHREGVHPDVHYLNSPEGKEIGIDEMRDFVSKTSLFPSSLPFRFFVVDGADLLTSAAANALLKPLEERNGSSRFILTTTSHQRVIRALRGRCGRVFFPLLAEDVVFSKVGTFEKDLDKALAIARLACGSIGRALSLWKSNGLSFRDKVFNLFQLRQQGDIPRLFEAIDELGKNPDLLSRFTLAIASDLVVPPGARKNVDLGSDLDLLVSGLGAEGTASLWRKLRAATLRYETSYVNLPFQMKAAFL